jgi:alpha-glucosidase (family GH31 glycosyl hydrolase)
MWWLDSSDVNNLVIDDQYLLGDYFLVAPVLDKGVVKRDIYLPKGSWIDGYNDSIKYNGPIWLRNYEAGIEIIPYFIVNMREID